MMTIYTGSKNRTCIQAMHYFDEHFIEYEIVLFSRMTAKQVKQILRASSLGTDEILKDHGKYSLSRKELNQMHLSELIQIILLHPLVLKSPIISDGKKLQVGFNALNLGKFLSRTRENRIHRELKG